MTPDDCTPISTGHTRSNPADATITMIPGELVPIGGPAVDQARFAALDATGWWHVEATRQMVGDGRRWFRATGTVTEDEAVALIEGIFPGATSDSEINEPSTTSTEPPERAMGSDPARLLAGLLSEMLDQFAAHDPNRLAEAGRAMYERFEQLEPDRMTRPGWKQIRSALDVLSVPTLDPHATGGPTGHTHPETSRHAGDQVRSGNQQHALLSLVVRSGREGLTCFEAAKKMGAQWPNISANQVGARMGELRKMGLVMRHEIGGVIQTRQAAASDAEVHVATDRGREELARLAVA